MLRLKLDSFEFELEDGAIVGRMEIGKEFFSGFPGISRQHARLDFDGRSWTVEDLQSTNGTFLNGQQLEPGRKYPVQIGDRLGFSRKVTFEVIATGA
jgi:3',5'-cyclic-nucleotide phosphodiesterase